MPKTKSQPISEDKEDQKNSSSVTQKNSAKKADNAPVRRSERSRRGVAPERFSPTTSRLRSQRGSANSSDEEYTPGQARAAARKAAAVSAKKKSAATTKKRKREEEEEEEEQEEEEQEEEEEQKEKRSKKKAPAMKQKTTPSKLSDDQEDALSGMKIGDLKGLLRANDQVVTGPSPPFFLKPQPFFIHNLKFTSLGRLKGRASVSHPRLCEEWLSPSLPQGTNQTKVRKEEEKEVSWREPPHHNHVTLVLSPFLFVLRHDIQCFGGRLRQRGNGYYCPGSYEDDKFVPCSYKARDCARVPWKNADGQCI